MHVRLTLIACAATAAMREGRFAAGDELDAGGRADARHLRGAIAPAGTPRAIAPAIAPERAVRETAQALGLEGAVDDALRDLDLGRWRGRTLAEIARTEPTSGRFVDDPGYDAHGGESIGALCRRIAAWLEVRRTVAGAAYAIATPAVLRAALVAAIGAPPVAFWNVEIGPLARLTLGADGRRWTLRSLDNAKG